MGTGLSLVRTKSLSCASALTSPSQGVSEGLVHPRLSPAHWQHSVPQPSVTHLGCVHAREGGRGVPVYACVKARG